MFLTDVEINPIQGATMIEGLFQPTHLLLIFGIALLVFGPKKLPELGKGIGEGIRGFKSAMKSEEEKLSSATTASNDKA
jgi:sec-independent protein translocase protein TatA